MSKSKEQIALDYQVRMNFPVENLAIAMWGIADGGPEGLDDDEIVERAARKILMLKKMVLATGLSEQGCDGGMMHLARARSDDMGIREARLRSQKEYDRFAERTDLHPAEREFLMATSDPHALHFKVSYYSFWKGQAIRDELSKMIGNKYNIDPTLINRCFIYHADINCTGEQRGYLETVLR